MERIYTESEIVEVAQEILGNIGVGGNTAPLLAFSGDLGAGKTTLTKAIAKALGVEEEITSPTFVIAKIYNTGHHAFAKLVHVDAYRIEGIAELGPLDFDTYLADPKNLVIVEWPEMIPEKIAQHANTHLYSIEHVDNESRRIHKK